MLPRSLRMRSSKDFRQTTRRGVRVSRPTLVIHAVLLDDGHHDEGTRVGFVVSGAVGNAVTRNRVKRRLRHLAATHVVDTPAGLGSKGTGPEGIGPEGIGPEGIGIVVCALPRAATDPAEVPTDFGSAWHDVMSRLTAHDPMKRRVR
ncbi:MAG TPA: ribonuclease P protein component [Propionibacteriaceae bacterium]